MSKFIILLLLIILSVCIFNDIRECFDLPPRERKQGPNIQIGVLHGSPPEVVDLMKNLNKIGGQLMADSQYDNIDPSLLGKQ